MEIKEIIVPENWECIIKNGIATFREKKQEPPRSWEEFCKRCPKQSGESYISSISGIEIYHGSVERDKNTDKNICVSEEEAKAFLALMQLRQLRKAWVGDWKQTKGNACAGIVYSVYENKFTVSFGGFWSNIILSFPTKEMAEEFLNCFRDLCEIAKILL